MKALKMALIAGSIFVSASAQAAVVGNNADSSATPASTGYLVAIIITAGDVTGIYECYDNGDGTA
jgi:hypothetical protein